MGIDGPKSGFSNVSGEESAAFNGLKTKERNPQRIVQKLKAAFPGSIGESVANHFSAYLKEEVTTPQQAEAYDRIMLFLDTFRVRIPLILRFSDWYLSTLRGAGNADEPERALNTQWLLNASEKEMEQYKKAILRQARQQQSKKARLNPFIRANRVLKKRMQKAGYYSEMVPLIRQLSPSYADYSDRLEALNTRICSELGLRYDEAGYLVVDDRKT